MKLKTARMQCTEIVGSNLATSKAYQATGLNIYIKSSPYLGSRVGGGDVYYVTSCDSGKVTRLMLADISGHGEAAADLATSLKSSLRKNADRISQSSFVQKVNQDFIKVSPSDRMATAVVATYFETQQRLALGLAGHPNPLLFRSKENRWHKIDEQVVESKNRFLNTPFGAVDNATYPTRNIQVETGDMFLLYSDAFIEAVNDRTGFLGIKGVLEVLNGMTDTPAKDLIPRLRRKIREFCPNNLRGDDATLILGHFTKAQTQKRSRMLSASLGYMDVDESASR